MRHKHNQGTKLQGFNKKINKIVMARPLLPFGEEDGRRGQWKKKIKYI
jgi:hypothetical protein